MTAGPLITKLKHITVPHGDVYHGIKLTEPSFCGFGELYFSRVEFKQVKGWKKHNKLTLNLIVPVGEVRFVVFESNPLTGQPTELVADHFLGADTNHQRLTIPPGFWLAFQGCDPTLNVVANVIPEVHDPTESDNLDLSAVRFDWHSGK